MCVFCLFVQAVCCLVVLFVVVLLSFGFLYFVCVVLWFPYVVLLFSCFVVLLFVRVVVMLFCCRIRSFVVLMCCGSWPVENNVSKAEVLGEPCRNRTQQDVLDTWFLNVNMHMDLCRREIIV